MRFGKSLSHTGLKYRIRLIKLNYDIEIAANLTRFTAIIL